MRGQELVLVKSARGPHSRGIASQGLGSRKSVQTTRSAELARNLMDKLGEAISLETVRWQAQGSKDDGWIGRPLEPASSSPTPNFLLSIPTTDLPILASTCTNNANNSPTEVYP